jgi:hypothetical protein
LILSVEEVQKELLQQLNHFLNNYIQNAGKNCNIVGIMVIKPGGVISKGIMVATSYVVLSVLFNQSEYF